MYTSPIVAIDGRWLLFRTKPHASLTVRLNPGKYYHGATVLGRDGKAYKIDTVTPDGIRLLDPAPPGDALSVSFPAAEICNIYDYAVGDSIEVAMASSLSE